MRAVPEKSHASRGVLRRVRAPLRLLQLLWVTQQHDVPSGPARGQRMRK